MANDLIEPRLTRVLLRNYKSIASCEVDLQPLSIFVGPNGSGKSNFLDALRLVADALRFSLGHALQTRGGFGEVRRKTATTALDFRIALGFRLRGCIGAFACVVKRKNQTGYVVASERCELEFGERKAYYSVQDGQVATSSLTGPPDCSPGEFYLARLGSIEPFRQAFRFLSNMTFYNPAVERMRELQASDDGRLLRRDGSNLASVLKRLKSDAPEQKQLVDDYLRVLVPQIAKVEPKTLGPKLTVEFSQTLPKPKQFRRFLAENMSDGTLRGLGVLVALFQGREAAVDGASLVGIEEPETSLHGGALGGLTDALLDASDHIQTLVTTHSVELLDSDDIEAKHIHAVESSSAGETQIGPLDEACQGAVGEGRFTVGELLGMGQARPQTST